MADRALKLGAAALGIAAALSGAEILARLAARRETPVVRGYFREDPELSYDIAPDFSPTETRDAGGNAYSLKSNRLGCYDEEFSLAAPERPVLLVGDSFTQGGLALKHHYGSVLEDALGRRVLKCGVTGYGTRQEMVKALRVARLAGVIPELIIVGYFPNDLEDDHLFPKALVVDGLGMTYKTLADYRAGTVRIKTRSQLEAELKDLDEIGEIVDCPPGGVAQKFKCGLYRRSALYRRVKEPLKGWVTRLPFMARLGRSARMTVEPKPMPAWLSSDGRPWLKQAWREHLRNLKKFDEEAKRLGSRLLVLVIPTREQVYPFLKENAGVSYPGDLDSPNKKLARFCREERLLCLDLLPYFRRYADPRPRGALDPARDFYWRDDGHWSPRGHGLAGLLLAERVLAEESAFGEKRGQLLAAVRERLKEFERRD